MHCSLSHPAGMGTTLTLMQPHYTYTYLDSHTVWKVKCRLTINRDVVPVHPVLMIEMKNKRELSRSVLEGCKDSTDQILAELYKIDCNLDDCF